MFENVNFLCKFNRPLLIGALGSMFFFSCTTADAVSISSESDVLASLASEGVDKHLAKVVNTAIKLNDTVGILCDKNNDANLDQARNAWRSANFAWKEASPFLIEPADTLGRQIGEPINDIVLKAVVESDEFAELRHGPDVRGYAGVEYLLFAPANAAQATADFRCDHLKTISSEIVSLTTIAKTTWKADFREGFVSAGDGLPYMTTGDALSLVVAQILNVTETVLRDHIGIPSNFFKDDAKPHLLEAPYSKSSREALQAVFKGIESALMGDGTTSIVELIATRDGLSHKKDPALAKSIAKQLQKIQKNLTKISKNNLVLYSAIEKDSASLKSLYKQLQTLQDKISRAVLVLELDIRAGLEAELSR